MTNSIDPNDRAAGPTAKGLEFLGAVAGGLVHEIRNPLSTMNITLQLLEEDWQGEEDGDDRTRRTMRRVRSIRREVGRLESILDDFLRYAGIRRLDLARADLNRIVDEVTAFVRPETKKAHVVLTFYPDRELPMMQLDERLIKQALLNLILNAIQAMEKHERSEGPHELIVRTAAVADSARIDIIDTGPGIPERDRERIFEVYFSSRTEGSGLGLPTARRIAEEHGGSLTLDSDVGKGSRFQVLLPLEGPERPAGLR